MRYKERGTPLFFENQYEKGDNSMGPILHRIFRNRLIIQFFLWFANLNVCLLCSSKVQLFLTETKNTALEKAEWGK